MEAVRLRQVDMDYRNHLQAWLNVRAKAEKRVGKNKKRLVYTKFPQFFNYEKAQERAKRSGKEESKFSGLKKFLRKGE